MSYMGSKRKQGKVRLLLCGRPWVECHYCGKRVQPGSATLDHIVPQSQGGNHSVSNLLLACRKCNCKRGSTPYQQFVQRIAA